MKLILLITTVMIMNTAQADLTEEQKQMIRDRKPQSAEKKAEYEKKLSDKKNRICKAHLDQVGRDLGNKINIEIEIRELEQKILELKEAQKVATKRVKESADNAQSCAQKIKY